VKSVTVKVPAALIDEFDEMIETEGLASRNNAVKILIRLAVNGAFRWAARLEEIARTEGCEIADLVRTQISAPPEAARSTRADTPAAKARARRAGAGGRAA
jgi:Arc/MetJ-type ribon-helix-helix transcriptional regulator